MFSIYHFIWLFICILIIIAILISYNKKRPSLDAVFKTASYICIFSEISKVFTTIKLVPSTNGELLLPYLPLNHLPIHLCSIQIILIFIIRFSKNKGLKENILAFMYPTSIAGAFFALLLPSIFQTTITPNEAFTSLISYQFFIYHSMLIALGIIIVKSNEVKWEFKHIKNAIIFVLLAGFSTLYLNSMFASPNYVDGKLISVDFWTNFFFTYQNPLNIQINEKWQWYLYLLILFVLVILIIFAFIYPLIKKYNKNKA